MRERFTVMVSRAKYAGAGGAIGGLIGGLISRNAASTGAAIGALAGAIVGEKRVVVDGVVAEIKDRRKDLPVLRSE